MRQQEISSSIMAATLLVVAACAAQLALAGGKGGGGEPNIIIQTGSAQSTKIKIMKVPVPYPVIKHVPYPVPIPIIQKKYIPVEKYIPVYKHHHHEGHHGGHQGGGYESQQNEQYAQVSPMQSQPMGYVQTVGGGTKPAPTEHSSMEGYAVPTSPYATQVAPVSGQDSDANYYSSAYGNYPGYGLYGATSASSLYSDATGQQQQQFASTIPNMGSESAQPASGSYLSYMQGAAGGSSLTSEASVSGGNRQNGLAAVSNIFQRPSASSAPKNSSSTATSAAQSSRSPSSSSGSKTKVYNKSTGHKHSSSAQEMMAVSSTPSAYHQSPSANSPAGPLSNASQSKQLDKQSEQFGQQSSSTIVPPTVVSLVLPSQQQQQQQQQSHSILSSTPMGDQIMQRLKKFTHQFTNSTQSLQQTASANRFIG